MKKIIGAIIFLAIAAGAFWGYQYYQNVFSPNVPAKLKSEFVLIPTNSTFKQVVDSLYFNGLIRDSVSFRQVADFMEYKRSSMRAGRFEVNPNWSNYDLVKHLRNGEQATVKVVLTVERMTENVAAKVSRFLESDSLAIVTLMQDDYYLKRNRLHSRNLDVSVHSQYIRFFLEYLAETIFLSECLKNTSDFGKKTIEREKQKKLGL
ncbi:MAG: endolytic transglycosylase MltG, partial [Saprospiraceae bacterium]|nr:endolytic transglycosylase MltG [Saprospiraceae bacterium]